MRLKNTKVAAEFTWNLNNALALEIPKQNVQERGAREVGYSIQN